MTCAATAANVNDTLVFDRLILTAFAVMACPAPYSPIRGL
jgi:hypothetical protein